ncbi:MAG: site-2 protease family protein [Kiritimatiellae bacterium]|nr:site-2 protease family protein [Kiritimatiellia bacterium]
MFKSSYRLCSIFGIPIQLDFSLIILMFLLIANYGDPLYGIASGIVLLVSITLHELGHSLVAIAFGCRVRDITLMMMGGCASLLSMPRKAWQEFLMAAAGPVVSLLLALAGLLLPKVSSTQGNLVFGSSFDRFIFFQVGALNAALFTFNLLPAFPMDGGRILRSLLQQFFMTRLRATWVASRIGRFVAVIMAISVIYSIFSGNVRGFMMIRLLIAWFIYKAAEREYLMVLAEESGARQNPFANFPFFRPKASSQPPPDDGKATVSPPPYERHGVTRVDILKED